MRTTKTEREDEEHPEARAVSFSMIFDIRPAASATPMIAATVVFLISAISVEPSGAIAPRNACGRITSRSDWPNVSPIDRAASACPPGTVLMPLRSASQTNAAW